MAAEDAEEIFVAFAAEPQQEDPARFSSSVDDYCIDFSTRACSR